MLIARKFFCSWCCYCGLWCRVESQVYAKNVCPDEGDVSLTHWYLRITSALTMEAVCFFRILVSTYDFSPEDGDMFFSSIGIYYKSACCHNPELHWHLYRCENRKSHNLYCFFLPVLTDMNSYACTFVITDSFVSVSDIKEKLDLFY